MKDNCVECGAPEPTMHNSRNWQADDKHCQRGPGFLCVDCWKRLNPLLFPEEVSKDRYVSWYKGPREYDRVQYLRYHPAGNFFQEFYPAGHEYVSSLSEATHYATYEQAKAVTPVYDGSSGIGSRSGVMTVPGYQPRPKVSPAVIVWALFAVVVFVGLLCMLWFSPSTHTTGYKACVSEAGNTWVACKPKQ